jgi:hypothetical protein
MRRLAQKAAAELAGQAGRQDGDESSSLPQLGTTM